MSESLRSWDAWHNTHQPWELQWWKEALAAGHSCDDAGFDAHWNPMREFIKPFGDVIDIGCGPRPPFRPCTVIEPLALDYLRIDMVRAEWWDGVTICAHPAEYRVGWLEEKGDTIICWNCLDHAIGWRTILDNMLSYARDAAARFAVATDFFPPFVGHPGFEQAEFMAEIEKRFVILDLRSDLDRQLALLLRARMPDVADF